MHHICGLHPDLRTEVEQERLSDILQQRVMIMKQLCLQDALMRLVRLYAR